MECENVILFVPFHLLRKTKQNGFLSSLFIKINKNLIIEIIIGVNLVGIILFICLFICLLINI